MKRVLQGVLYFALGASVSISYLLPSVSLASTCETWVAKAVSVQGTVVSQRAGEKQWQQVNLNDTFCPGDTLTVHEESRADVLLSNESVLRLNENSSITLEEVKKEGTSLVDLFKGTAHFFSRRPRSLDVRTPSAICGVRGTEFLIRVEEEKTFMSVFEGEVLASNEAGSVAVTSGQSALAEAGKAPVLRVVVRPRDAVQWALYYPPVIYVGPEQGRPKEDAGDPRFLTHRASLLIAVGRVDEANADIERALVLRPDYSDAYALQSIIALVQNDKEKALSLAQRAVEADPSAAAARVALSYAQQARFDLEGARVSLQEAVKLDPSNALAWARLAEIQSSFGDLDKSLEAARKAVALDPNVARTQTVLGFAYLTEVKTKESRESFEKAITLDQADYLPRLGLGLAKIRDGNLKEGRQEIEIAASLDPNNAIVRSYLGKVYYEEKRGKLDEREYAVAKELDPNDPTPYFYDAIAKQTTNRPVEALQELQKAIELNDNRAVYRSTLLLDSDLAARSASLARIYGDLGFQQLALVEGWKSVNTDPGNFSAHRFLADSYSVLPRHEIARVSELLQSQLLQPINITPIQPRLAESNLFLISAQGPGALSFSEFNPIFNRNRAAVQASGVAGENDTWGGEGIVSGMYDRFSFSAGYNHFETDGWRENADQDDDIANAFAQYEISHKTSIQAEYRYRDTKSGDLQLRFFSDDFLPNLKEEEETKLARLGARHAFSPNSVLIGNFMYQDAERSEQDEPLPILTTDLKGDDDAYSGEIQHLYRSERLNLVGGLGHFNIDSKDILTTVLSPPPIIIPPPDFPPGLPPIEIPVEPDIDIEKIDRDVNHTNVYLYSYLNLLENMTLTIGASGDFYDSDIPGSEDKDQFNPKFGITFNPLPDTTLRGAVFRTLKRTLITDQTLEPTQVAGFNQFFDEDNATDAWNYGAAIDQKFLKNLYGGAQFTYRDLEVPSVGLTEPPKTFESNWEESLLRVYLFWAPHRWLGLSAEYLYEDIERKKGEVDGAEEVETHYLPLGISFFHPSGISATLRGIYVDQEGRFDRRSNAGVFESGDDDFWVMDAGIGYRLPRRHGFISVGATNLFDEEFNYYSTDPDNPHFQPDRALFAKITLAFP